MPAKGKSTAIVARRAASGLKAKSHRQANTSLALKAYRLAKRNAKSIDYDHLQEDVTNTSILTSSGWQIKEFGIAQGDTTGTRQGDEVFLRKLWVKGMVKTLSATDQSTVVRMLVGYAYNTANFSTSNLPGNGTEQALYKMLDKKQQDTAANSMFKVYKDFRFTVNVVGDEAKRYFQFLVPIFKKQHYTGASSGAHKGAPFIAFRS